MCVKTLLSESEWLNEIKDVSIQVHELHKLNTRVIELSEEQLALHSGSSFWLKPRPPHASLPKLITVQLGG